MVLMPKWKIALILIISLIGLALSAPNFLDDRTARSLPDWLPSSKVNLGLDLRGGVHLLAEVDVDGVMKQRLEDLEDDVRGALREAGVVRRTVGVSGEGVVINVREQDDFDKARSALEEVRSQHSSSLLQLTGIGGAAGAMELTEDQPGRFRLGMTEEMRSDVRKSAVTQSIEVIRRRIDETGTREPTIQQQGEDRILLQLPGVDNPERVKEIIGTTAKMTFHLVDTDPDRLGNAIRSGRAPAGTRLLSSNEDGQSYLIRRRVMVDGGNLVDARPGVGDAGPEVNIRFDAKGSRDFADATTDNVGRPFAIVLDDNVISAPVIREPILGGSARISGNFSVQSANDLALVLRAGALPAPITFLEERTVGPGLGADSIAAGEIASIIGLVAVIIFMGLSYGLFGIFANAALILNMFMILGALSLLQATLTLPGIAGIVLTIGMAVDANVLIFERIREEVRNGRSPMSAIESGYSRAMITIIDANITTLIAALMLFEFGSGPVKGFAVTLAIGIVTSMFTAIMVTRLFVVTWLRRRRPTTLPI
jgi:preprotein translocase subunit SecD